jgi:hypothetical protein
MADVFETALHLGTAHSQSPSELLAFILNSRIFLYTQNKMIRKLLK